MNVSLCSSVLALFALAGAAAAQQTTFTQWNFNTGPTGTVVNNPAPSLGQGTAVPLGMTNNYYFSPPVNLTGSVTACDLTGGGGSGDTSATNNCWRVRGSVNGTFATAGHGWSISAPQRTQGAEFAVSTVNYQDIVFSFDWFCTNQGVHNMQIQYSLNGGGTWITVDNTLAGVLITAGAPTATVNPLGQVIHPADATILNCAVNGWVNNNIVDFTNVAGANNNPNFRVRLVSVYDPAYAGPGSPTYTAPTGTAQYNNNSGNWRFDRVTFKGVATGSVPPSGVGSSVNPPAVCSGGGPLLFTVTAVPGAGPISDNGSLAVTADLSGLGLSATQQFFDNGTNGDAIAGDGVFSYLATVPSGLPTGSVTNLTAVVSDTYTDPNNSSNHPPRSSASFSIGTVVNPSGPGSPVLGVRVGDCASNSTSQVVISQTFGAGGRLGDLPSQDAPFNADYVEIYNRSNQPVNINGWSIQYASQGSSGGFDSAADQVPLSGIMQPGQYRLIRMADPIPGFNALPTPDFAQITGLGGMGNSGGRVALVKSTLLMGNDLGNPLIEDLVGYGAGTISYEGVAPTPDPVPSSNKAILRKSSGAQDTNQNFNDFVSGTPNPRNRAAGGFLAGYASGSFSAVCSGSSVTFTVAVSPGSSSTGIQVVADVSQVTGVPASTVQLFDDGPAGGHGDANLNDGIYTLYYTVPANAPVGNHTLTITVSDAQSNSDVSTLPLAVGNCNTAPAAVVISQVYGGGGNAGSGFNADFAEIHNRSNHPVSIDGWSFQSARVTDVDGFVSRIVPLSGTMQPGEFRLIITNTLNATGAALPAADFIPANGVTFGMESNSGRVVLVSSMNFVGTDYSRADVVDHVGYGTESPSFEGVGPTIALDDIHVAVRKNGGCQDTNNNAIDFDSVLALSLPRNSASPVRICPCSKADIAGLGSSPGGDGQLTVDDLVFYLSAFFSNNLAVADITNLGGQGQPDGLLTVDDLVAFLAAFFAGCQ